MTRDAWSGVLTVMIGGAIIQGSLCMRGIKPSRRIGLWDHIFWRLAPRDQQTKVYLRQGLLTAIVILPAMLLARHVLFRIYDAINLEAVTDKLGL
jgi:hypothetical protein